MSANGEKISGEQSAIYSHKAFKKVSKREFNVPNSKNDSSPTSIPSLSVLDLDRDVSVRERDVFTYNFRVDNMSSSRRSWNLHNNLVECRYAMRLKWLSWFKQLHLKDKPNHERSRSELSYFVKDGHHDTRLGYFHHELALKIGAQVMCLRNVDQKDVLCNGTRMEITRMATNIIEAKTISEGKVGTVCAIPRMVITPSDKKMPFELNRRQFHVYVCFGMIINKS
ncbi:ATP-dependent DNA helicase PIF1-like protein [Tanacetum coccineum]